MPTSAAAEPDYAQAKAQLKLANLVRTTNARTIRDIANLPYVDGIDAVIEVLENGDEKGPLGALSIGRLLTAPRWMGEERARVVLRSVSIVSGDRRLRQITMRQREQMALHLRYPEALWPGTMLPRLRRERDQADA